MFKKRIDWFHNFLWKSDQKLSRGKGGVVVQRLMLEGYPSLICRGDGAGYQWPFRFSP